MKKETAATLGLFFISLLATPLLYFLKFLNDHNDGKVLFFIGVGICFTGNFNYKFRNTNINKSFCFR
jgi:hypothetical protein